MHHCPKKPAVTNDSPAISDNATEINKKFDKLDIFGGDQHFQVFTKAGGKSDGKNPLLKLPNIWVFKCCFVSTVKKVPKNSKMLEDYELDEHGHTQFGRLLNDAVSTVRGNTKKSFGVSKVSEVWKFKSFRSLEV